MTGLVISDLHLFARRSEGAACFEALRSSLSRLDLLVLNGDIFDFRWSALPSRGASVAAAIAWLEALLPNLPGSRVHYILGNHDCLADFAARLGQIGDRHPNFQWHPAWLQMGSALFLHGDGAHGDPARRSLEECRAPWRHDHPRGRWAAAAYAWADRLGLTRRAHEWHFPRHRTVERIARYLDQACPEWRTETRDCYFGHTHLPFADYAHDGIRFHNTGSAIRGAGFNPLRFHLPSTEPGSGPIRRESEVFS